jgi:hypothetical protein
VLLLDASPAASAGAGAGPDEDWLRARARTVSERDPSAHSSRSYSFPLALVACHNAAVGVDIELVAPCDQAFIESIQTPAERAEAADREPDGDPDRAAVSLWSSKEALSKALGDALAYDPRRLEGPGGWRDGRSGPWRASTLDVGVGYVGWVCWRVS